MKASLLTHPPGYRCAPSGSTCFYTYCNGCNGVRWMISIRVERYQLAGKCESWDRWNHNPLEKGAAPPLTKPIDLGMLRSEIDMRIERAA